MGKKSLSMLAGTQRQSEASESEASSPSTQTDRRPMTQQNQQSGAPSRPAGSQVNRPPANAQSRSALPQQPNNNSKPLNRTPAEKVMVVNATAHEDVACIDDIADLKREKAGEILTAQGGQFQQPEEVRKFLCYMRDGRLFIAKTHQFHPHVTAFKAKLSRLGHAFDVITVSPAGIQELYGIHSSDQTAKREHSKNQNDAKALFEKAVIARASDIHIRVSAKTGTSVYFRIHNDLEFIQDFSYEDGDQFCATIYQAMADVSDATFKPNSRQDARISNRAKLPEKLDGIRIATSPQVDGYIMVMRMLYNDTTESSSLFDLGYTPEQQKTIELAKRRPTGINIIAGPTGSGKSTTLQRVLTGIIKGCNGRKHIITVEDPPEYPIPQVVQTPVTNADTEEERSVQFQLAIKSAMRLDPDIIMIGEMRDKPSVRLALQAAMTGHQVWTTLHANNAIAIIDRIMDLGVPLEVVTDSSIISSLTCQRLLKVLCPHCKQKLSDVKVMSRYPDFDLHRIMSVAKLDDVYVKGEGCDHCNHTGIIGRTVVAETIITDQKLMSLLKAQNRMGVIDYWKNEQQGITMIEHAIMKVQEGITDPFDAEDVVGPLTMASAERDHSLQHNEIQSALGSSPNEF